MIREKNPTTVLSILSLLILALVAVGCGTATEKQEPPKQEKEAPKAETQSPAVTPENQQQTSVADTNLDIAVPNENMGPFDQKVQEEKKRTQYEQYLVQSYLDTAKKHAEQNKYQDAYHLVHEALKLDPTNQEALMLKNSYGSKLGFQPEEISERLSEAEKIVNVKVEQTRLEVDNRINNGKNLLAQKQYEPAIALFKQAKEILRWMPYHVVDLEGKSRHLDFLIQKAEEEKKIYEEDLKRRRMVESEEQAKREELARLKTVDEQVRSLLRQANLAFEKEKYDLAESFCEQVLVLNPDHKEVKPLIRLIREARHSKVSEKSRLLYFEEWKKTFAQIDEAMIPTHNIVEFPSYETWKTISKRGSKQSGTQESEESDLDRKVRERLETETLSMDFSEAPLREVVDFLRSTTGINFIIDPDVYKEFQEGEEALKVDLTVNKLRLGGILNLILSMKGLAYRLNNGVVIISTKKRITEKTKLRLYNVRDLTGKLNDFPAMDISLSSKGSGEDGTSGVQIKAPEIGENRPVTTITEEQLTDLIKNNIAKATWDTATSSIDARYGTLIIRQTESVHKQIESLLNDLRKSTGLLVTLETRFLTVTDDFLEDVGVDWRSLGTTNIGSTRGGEFPESRPGDEDNEIDPGLNPGDVGTGYDWRNMDDAVFGNVQDGNTVGTGTAAGLYYKYGNNVETRQRLENIFDQALDPEQNITSKGGLSMQMAYIDEVELQMILHAVRKKSRKNVLTAPRLTVFNTQRANVTIVTQHAYVQDYTVEIATNATIADPVIGTVQDGVVLDVRPIISADRKYITMELQPTVAALTGGTVGTIDVSLASSSAANSVVKIGTPQLTMTRIRSTVTIPDGGTLLLGGMLKGQENDEMSGVPVLSDIPLISYFVSRQGKFMRKESLLILVTAKITSMEEQEPNEGRQ